MQPTKTKNQKAWFITGISRGSGRETGIRCHSARRPRHLRLRPPLYTVEFRPPNVIVSTSPPGSKEKVAKGRQRHLSRGLEGYGLYWVDWILRPPSQGLDHCQLPHWYC